MSHTVHPYAHRLGILRGWKSRWFGNGTSQYRTFLKEDVIIREFLTKKLRGSYISAVEMERSSEGVLRIIIKSSRPGMIIGRQGEGATKLKEDVERLIARKKLSSQQVKIDIEEVRFPDTDAAIVAQMIAEGLERRLPFRRVLKQTMEKVMMNRGVKGARFLISGRLGGAEMGRKEGIKKGVIPLQTFRADIDFARERAVLPYGTIGIKVWINRGEVFEKKNDNKKS